jgi:hypothetical protein
MKKLLVSFIIVIIALACGNIATAQSANAGYPESQLNPGYATDTGAVNVLVVTVPSCPAAYQNGAVFKVVPNHANTTTTPTLNVCGLGAKTITKNGIVALASNDLITTAIAIVVYDGTDMELVNPQTSSCATCVTSAASLASTNLMTGAGGQGAQTNANIQVTTGGIFSLYDNITTAGLGVGVVEAVSDVTAQSASQTTVNLVSSTGAAGHYLVRIYVDQNALCTTGTGSVFATLSWTDASHAHTAQTIPLTLANSSISSTLGFVDAAIPLWSAASDAISYTTTYTACATGTGTYDLHAELERTN